MDYARLYMRIGLKLIGGPQILPLPVDFFLLQSFQALIPSKHRIHSQNGLWK